MKYIIGSICYLSTFLCPKSCRWRKNLFIIDTIKGKAIETKQSRENLCWFTCTEYTLKMNICYFTLWFVLTLVLPLSSSSLLNKKTPALYIFGDSLIDCGNNIHLPSGGDSFLPYGIDFKHGKPTGRATNGKTVADFLGNITVPFGYL